MAVDHSALCLDIMPNKRLLFFRSSFGTLLDGFCPPRVLHRHRQTLLLQQHGIGSTFTLSKHILRAKRGYEVPRSTTQSFVAQAATMDPDKNPGDDPTEVNETTTNQIESRENPPEVNWEEKAKDISDRMEQANTPDALVKLRDEIYSVVAADEGAPQALYVLHFSAITKLKLLQAMQESKVSATPSRLVDIDYKITDTELITPFDLTRFAARIEEQFDWYSIEEKKREETRKTYLSPYFPMVQSSGMGKTKLLFDFKKQSGINCVLIKCADVADYYSNTGRTVFDHVVVPPSYNPLVELETVKARENFRATLDYMLQQVDHPGRVVFMFDEAQHLMANNGFFFRVARWWIREGRFNHDLVAVFSGTTSSLANFFKEIPLSTTSRNLVAENKSLKTVGTKLYPPFYDILSAGCFGDDVQKESARTEYERAIYFGRPLFAVMVKNNDAMSYEKILTKMTLAKSQQTWTSDTAAVFSILATRVQMGQVAVDMTSRLVADGYAGLTMFSTDQYGNNQAQMCHFVDPVCARLAMCLMDESIEIAGYRGASKEWWVKQVCAQYSSGFCRPAKGDTAEVFAALYLLFCGDVLRAKAKENNIQGGEKYVHFSVSLHEWARMLSPNSVKSMAPKIWPNGGPEISFIQVCRNYLRLRVQDLLKQSVLKEMYESGAAYYTNPERATFDIFAAIRMMNQNGEFEYVPLMVQVKSKYDDYGREGVVAILEKMEGAVCQAGYSTGLCLLVRLGIENSEAKSEDLKLNESDVDLIGSKIVSKLVVIPNDDPFGLTAAFTSITSEREELAEVCAMQQAVWSQARGWAFDAETALQPTYREIYKKAEEVDPPLDLFSSFVAAIQQRKASAANKASSKGDDVTE